VRRPLPHCDGHPRRQLEGELVTSSRWTVQPRTQAELDAERSVLGAVLAAGSLDRDAGFRTLDLVIATGLDPNDFYVASLGTLFSRLIDHRERELPLDPVNVAYELEKDGAEPSTVGRLHQLAHEVVAITPAPRWAAIVAEAGRWRRAA
jgi:replicative DNA helicase